MSAPGPEFAKQQQDLASKKHSDLQDHEKIYLMRREIDHLRSVIRSQNDGSLQSAAKPSASSSSASSSSMDRAPILTLFLFVGLIVVAIWRRKRQGSGGTSSTTTRSGIQSSSMTLELQDSLAGYEAPATNTNTARGQIFTMNVQNEEEEALTIRI